MFAGFFCYHIVVEIRSLCGNKCGGLGRATSRDGGWVGFCTIGKREDAFTKGGDEV